MTEAKELTCKDLKSGDRIEVEIGNKEGAPFIRFATYIGDTWCVLEENVPKTLDGGTSFGSADSLSHRALMEGIKSERANEVLRKAEEGKTWCWGISKGITKVNRVIPRDDELTETSLTAGDRLEVEVNNTTYKATYIGLGWLWLDRVDPSATNPSKSTSRFPSNVHLSDEARAWKVDALTKPKLKRLLPERSELQFIIETATIQIASRVEVSIDTKDGIKKVMGTYLGNDIVWLDEMLDVETKESGRRISTRDGSGGRKSPKHIVLSEGARCWEVSKNESHYTRISRVLDEKAKLKLIDDVSETKPEPKPIDTAQSASNATTSEISVMKTEIAGLRSIVEALVRELKAGKPETTPVSQETPKEEPDVEDKVLTDQKLSFEELKKQAVRFTSEHLGKEVLLTRSIGSLCPSFGHCKHTIKATIIAIDKLGHCRVGWKSKPEIPAVKGTAPGWLAEAFAKVPNIDEYSYYYTDSIESGVVIESEVKSETVECQHDHAEPKTKESSTLSFVGLAMGAMAGAAISAMANKAPGVRVAEIETTSIVEEAVEQITEGVAS